MPSPMLITQQTHMSSCWQPHDGVWDCFASQVQARKMLSVSISEVQQNCTSSHYLYALEEIPSPGRPNCHLRPNRCKNPGSVPSRRASNRGQRGTNASGAVASALVTRRAPGAPGGRATRQKGHWQGTWGNQMGQWMPLGVDASRLITS